MKQSQHWIDVVKLCLGVYDFYPGRDDSFDGFTCTSKENPYDHRLYKQFSQVQLFFDYFFNKSAYKYLEIGNYHSEKY